MYTYLQTEHIQTARLSLKTLLTRVWANNVQNTHIYMYTNLLNE